MRKILLILTIITCTTVTAQPYLQQDIGMTFNDLAKAELPVINLHMGYQFNSIIGEKDAFLLEYNQRVLLGTHNPKYIGGRAGYGLTIGEYTMFAIWGGYYYRLISGDFKGFNYWIPGYGISAVYKRVSFQFMFSELYEVSIGGRILLE